MSEFWTSFVSGLASGIMLTAIGAFIRRFLQKRRRGDKVKIDAKTLRPFVSIIIGFAMVFIDIYLVTSMQGFLMAFGGMILLWSAQQFLD